MDSPDETVRKVPINISKTMITICDALDIKPELIWNEIQSHITGSSNPNQHTLTLIAHLYLASTLENTTGIERAEIEDFLNEILAIRKSLPRYEFELKSESEITKAIEELCIQFNSRRNKNDRNY